MATRVNRFRSMKSIVVSRLSVLALCACLSTMLGISAIPQSDENSNLNVALMKSTFRIRGRTSGGEPYAGTVFLLGIPVSNKEGAWRMVMVTADHVLSNTRGELAEIILRQQDANATWHRY